VRVLNEPIEDGVRQGGVTSSEGWMPGFNRQLADYQRRAHLAAVVDHLQQILGLDDAGWRQQKIIQYEQPNASELSKTTNVAAGEIERAEAWGRGIATSAQARGQVGVAGGR
jgi:hypothetical protein